MAAGHREDIAKSGTLLKPLALLGGGLWISLVGLFAAGGYLGWYPSRLGYVAGWIEDHILALGLSVFSVSHGGNPLAAVSLYLAFLVLGFGCYFAALRLANRLGAGTTRHLWLVLAVSLACAIGLTWQPYVSSQDIFSYALYARIWAIYSGNPLVETPRDFLFDPLFAAVFWKDQPSNYGPLWTYLSGLAAVVGFPDVATTLVLHKALVAFAVLLGVPLVWGILGRLAPRQRLVGTILYAWNPLLAFETFGNGHNDAVMAVFVLLGLWLRTRRHPYFGLAALVASTLVKYVSVIVIPLYLVDLLLGTASWRERALIVARSAVVALVLTVLAFAPVYRGPQTLQVIAFGSTPLAYTNTPLEIVFRELRVALGESREAAALPLRYRAWWGEARTPTVFWTRLDDPSATGWGLETGASVLIVEPPVRRWFRVYDPVTGRFGYVPTVDIVQAPPPIGTSGLSSVTDGMEDVTQSPTARQANLTLRISASILFVLAFGALMLRVLLRRRSLVRPDLNIIGWSALACLLLSYWLVEMWFWPWYLIWALPFAALVPRSRLTALLLAFSLTALVLNVQASLDIAPFLAPLYEYRSLAIFGFPIALAIAWDGPRVWRAGPVRRASAALVDSFPARWVAQAVQPLERAAVLIRSGVGGIVPRQSLLPLAAGTALGLLIVASWGIGIALGLPSDESASAREHSVQSDSASLMIAWRQEYDTALERLQERRIGEAEAALTRAIGYEPAIPVTYHTRARVYAQLGRYDAAIDDLSRVLAIDGQTVDILVERGDVYAQKQRFDLAIADFSRAAEIDPRDPRPYHFRALAYQSLGDLARSRVEFVRALQSDPNDASTFRQFGDTLAAAGEYREAAVVYDRAVALDRNLTSAYVGRAVVTRLTGDYHQTVPDLEQVLALSPDLNEQTWARQALSAISDEVPGNALTPR